MYMANCCHTVGVRFAKYCLMNTTVVTNKVCCSCMHTIVNATFAMYQNLLKTVSSVIPEKSSLGSLHILHAKIQIEVMKLRKEVKALLNIMLLRCPISHGYD